jgi:hypothetical protein
MARELARAWALESVAEWAAESAVESVGGSAAAWEGELAWASVSALV